MRVLVTGSEGRIGKEVVRTLESNGDSVRSFDRCAAKPADRREHIPGDLREINAVRSAVQGVDAVCHLGAISNDRLGRPEDILSINVQGTWNVLLACMEAGVKRLVHFSSVQALGNFQGHRVTDYFPIGDSYPSHPMSAYQVSKLAGEEMCAMFARRYGLQTVSLRPVFVAWPEMYARFPHALDRESGDYWSYVDIRDVCSATLKSLTVEGIVHDEFLLAAADTACADPTAELIDRHFSQVPWTVDRSTYLSGRPYRSLVDCSHATEVLGWTPQHSWRNGK